MNKQAVEKLIHDLTLKVWEAGRADLLEKYYAQNVVGHYRQTIFDFNDEVLYYFMNGYSAKEIAQMLRLTYRTVQTYFASVKHKYHCSSKNALRKKLFPVGPWT